MSEGMFSDVVVHFLINFCYIEYSFSRRLHEFCFSILTPYFPNKFEQMFVCMQSLSKPCRPRSGAFGQSILLTTQIATFRLNNRPRGYKTFSCTTQLCVKLSLLTIVGIFIFISREIFMLIHCM